jgi:HSP20 family protein
MYVTKYRPSRTRKPSLGFDLLESMMDELVQKQGESIGGDFMPTVNTREGDDAYYIELDLPGIKKSDIDVDIKDNLITIKGERKTDSEVKEDDYYSIESKFGMFERSFTLPEDVNIDKIEANSKDGVLEVVIPKEPKKDEKPKKIKIK